MQELKDVFETKHKFKVGDSVGIYGLYGEYTIGAIYTKKYETFFSCKPLFPLPDDPTGFVQALESELYRY